MKNNLFVFEENEVLLLTKDDVILEFKGDFLIHLGDTSRVMEYDTPFGLSKVIKDKYLIKLMNRDISDSTKGRIRKLNNAGELFISSFGLYQAFANSTKPKAERFQNWLFEETIPSIQKHGMYAIDDLLDNPDLLIMTATKLKEERERRIAAEREKERLQSEVEHKENVIIGLVDEISLAEKRQVLVQVVRKGGLSKVQDRWAELYRQFEKKYHINLKLRLRNYNAEHKPRLKNKLEYIDKVMKKMPELYEIACKLYENDVKQLVQEMYELNSVGSLHEGK